ncbi:MAG: hypothetical protein Q8M24_21835 [Pseudolabrys sp.]|nr:hypothetical protein [Pseudolabrys sp.]MDP2298092.1 hypothetical protein [Pseudolabrys sp.]
MPILLYGVGALVVAMGVATIGFGVPINEFSFGNTLIIAGTTAAVGGLIVIALGVAVAQLQRLADALATRSPIRSSRPFDTFDPAAAVTRPPAAPARVPFPPKTKAEPKVEARPPEPRIETPRPPAVPVADRFDDYAPPVLANPDEPPVTVADEAFLSPLHPAQYSRAPAPPAMDLDRTPGEGFDDAPRAGLDDAPRKSHTYFDAMWPAEPKSTEPKAAEPKFAEPKSPEPKPVEFRAAEQVPDDDEFGEPTLAESKPAESKPAEPKLAEPNTPAFPWSDMRRSEPVAADQHEEPADEEAPRAVAILKSGVVDGMGYTLYVDGSIEAELPQGTLRFASINELRSHLEKTS